MLSGFDDVRDLFHNGGPVMWPLLTLSVISVALTVERSVFWWRQQRGGRRAWLARLSDRARSRDEASMRAMIGRDRSIYARVAERLLGDPPAGGAELVELARYEAERFGATQSVIITAAPLLGILGTVLGIIDSFDLLGASDRVADLSAVSRGIAEALITTAFGLVVALITLFPYMAFRAQANACLSLVEGLCDTVERSFGRPRPAGAPAAADQA